MAAVAACRAVAPPAPQRAATPDGAATSGSIAVAVALGALLEVVDTSIVNVALTDMQNSLGATLSEVSWVVSSYAVANVIILPLTAWLGDRFGKKRYFVFSLIAFTLASMLCGLSTNLPMLIIARVLQGLGGGGLLAKAQAILFETFPKEEQAMAQGFFGAIVIAGPAIGPTLGGYLVDQHRLALDLLHQRPGRHRRRPDVPRLPPTDEADAARHGQRRLDRPSPARRRPRLAADGARGGPDARTGSTRASSSRSPSPPSSAWSLFVWRELAAEHPVVDLRVLRYRSLWAGSILSIVVGMALYGTLFAVPIFAQSVLHYTSQQTGMLLLPERARLGLHHADRRQARRQVRRARAARRRRAHPDRRARRGSTNLSPLTGEDDLFCRSSSAPSARCSCSCR